VPGLVDALLAAPAGVVLLAALEREPRPDVSFLPLPARSDPAAVGRAAAWVAGAPTGAVLAAAVEAAEALAGPWTPAAPGNLAVAFRSAAAWRPIAEALVAAHGATLVAPFDAGAQEVWLTGRPVAHGPRFADLGAVYGGGEFPWAGLWTVTDPPPAAHDGLVSAWELFDGPVSRWRLPVRPGARVWTVDGPEEWAALVRAYPRPAVRPHGGWELPGPNQRPADLAALLAVPTQTAARGRVAAHLLPDWAAVAADHDGVHLSWAGFLTTEGRVVDLGDGAVTMLRYWASERTLWLADVFGEPEPRPAPRLSGRVAGLLGADPGGDLPRAGADRAELARVLGR
jgi:hypothetical protein